VSTPSTPSVSSGTPWLLLIHQIPPKPNYLRVKVWRRLQRLGAVAIKNSVYVLPKSESAHEDFEWVRQEIAARGGEASICEAHFVEGLEDEQIRRMFHAARDADYAQVAEETRLLLAELPVAIPDDRRVHVEAALDRLRRRFLEIAAIDFFSATGQQVVDGLLSSIESRLQQVPGQAGRPAKSAQRESVQGRTWVTRADIHVDRMASGWLIRRFIDRDAKFKFVIRKAYRPEPEELRFDMFEAEFTHEGDLCTFEVLIERFGLDDPALRPIAEIVHDIDLKDAKFGRPETAGIDHVITGIARTHTEDAARLERAAALFNDLYEYFKGKRG
jgi:hypothetical protein